MKVLAGIVGSGNIATDLLFKLQRSDVLEPRYMVGIDPTSDGLRRAAAAGLETSSKGLPWLLERRPRPQIIFEATSARAHRDHAVVYRKVGVPVVDLTPAAVGPYVVPVANLSEHAAGTNVNLISCGGQATIPIVHAVSRVVPVEYAEIVASVASKSAGPGTRANIDEFTRTTTRGLETVGGARRGKAIIILNPAEPPLIMRNTIFCSVPQAIDRRRVADSIAEVVAEVQRYVPGYRLTAEPQFADGRVVTLIEVEGAGDYFPSFAGNLDIMTAAAVRIGEEMARPALGEG